tara:strand:+ start:1316 stop:1963 length:648 start_codon:yes stop_codon:yes gene_type:complete
MAVTREILKSHPLSSLKTEVAKVKKSLNYGKLKKEGLIDLILKNKEHFNHIKKYEAPPKPTPKPKEPEKPKPKPKEPEKPTPKPESKPTPRPGRVDSDCISALEIAIKVIKFYTENKGIFARDKYLIKNKKDLEEKINTIKKILNDPRCENIKTRTPFRPSLEEALKLHLEKSEPKKRQKKFKVGESITFGGATKPKPRQNLIRNPAYQTTGGKA